MRIKYIIFDLDDTLMYEIDFLKSAYKEITEFIDKENSQALFKKMFLKFQDGENVFDFLLEKYPGNSKEQLLNMYRNHFPDIKLGNNARETLAFCQSKDYKIGLITDGRSITQRNKLKALGIENIFNKIIISEEFGSTKPTEKNFQALEEESVEEYIYIADNPKKDFVTPNKMGWLSICLLDSGHNIHHQSFDLPSEFLPQIKIKDISEVQHYI